MKNKSKQADTHTQYKCALIILVLILLGTGILAAVLATQHTTVPDQAATKGDSAPPSGASSPSGTGTASHSASSPSGTTIPADPHAATAACISQFNALTTNGEAYPCGSCVPALSSLPNDFAAAVPDINSTAGPGAALQFCALRDVLDSVVPGVNNTLKDVGWGKNGSVCGWPRVGCDPQGRVVAL